MADNLKSLLKDIKKSIRFTFTTSTFPIPGVSSDEETYRFEQLKLKFPDLSNGPAIYLAFNPEIYQKVINSNISTEQAYILVKELVKIQTGEQTLLDELPEIKLFLNKLYSLLDSKIFWNICYFILALIFLILFYNFSEIGRFVRYDTGILDTRSGIIHAPGVDMPQHDLKIPGPKDKK